MFAGHLVMQYPEIAIEPAFPSDKPVTRNQGPLDIGSICNRSPAELNRPIAASPSRCTAASSSLLRVPSKPEQSLRPEPPIDRDQRSVPDASSFVRRTL